MEFSKKLIRFAALSIIRQAIVWTQRKFQRKKTFFHFFSISGVLFLLIEECDSQLLTMIQMVVNTYLTVNHIVA